MYQFKLNDPHFLPQYGCDIDFSLEAGKVLSIVGENGLGKTTLLKRFYQEYFHQISYIEQAALDFFYDRKLHKFKDVFLTSRKENISEAFFEDCWQQFSLNKKEDRLQSQLSGGEGQALKIALGFASVRDIYVMDEPSQYLDDRSKKVLSELIQNLLQNGKSVLMVEHDLNWQTFPMSVVELERSTGILKKGKSWTT
jgi:ABC-type Mn2+/Zn2+ transport system ATPase subunit